MLLILLIIIILIIYLYKKYKNKDVAIDIVYTWAGEKHTNNIRNSNNNELKYSLRSIMKYAPWVNHIYILTDTQQDIPSWFVDNNKYKKLITIVDLKQTFPKDYILPNHNSNAIETTIVNIPNLKEHFIYFNDDFFLSQNASKLDFFTQDGKARVSSSLLNEVSMLNKNKLDKLKFKYPKTARGFHPHVPVALLKSSIIAYQKEYVDYINWVRSIKTRATLGCDECKLNNLMCPCQAQHYPIVKYMYDNNKAVLKYYDKEKSKINKNIYVYVNGFNHLYKLNNILKNPPKMFCINDKTYGERDRQIMYDKVNEFFKAFFPEKPWFEK
jgi:hypothetical protein